MQHSLIHLIQQVLQNHNLTLLIIRTTFKDPLLSVSLYPSLCPSLMRSDSLLRLLRYINHLLTYLHGHYVMYCHSEVTVMYRTHYVSVSLRRSATARALTVLLATMTLSPLHGWQPIGVQCSSTSNVSC